MLTLTVTCEDCGRTANVPAGEPSHIHGNGVPYTSFNLSMISFPVGWGDDALLHRCSECYQRWLAVVVRRVQRPWPEKE